MINEFGDEFDPLKRMYRGWVGDGFHPNSPSGGGGPGFFMPAQQWGRTVKQIAGLPDPFSPAGLRQTAEQIKEKFRLPDPIPVTDIPAVMRKNNWPMGAAVMEKWFAQDAYQMTGKEKEGGTRPDQYPQQLINTKLFTMAWLMQFSAVKEGRTNLLKNLQSARAIEQLRLFFTRLRQGLHADAAAPLIDIEYTDFKIERPSSKNKIKILPQKHSKLNGTTLDRLIHELQTHDGNLANCKTSQEFCHRLSMAEFLNRTWLAKIGAPISYKTLTGIM